MGCCITGKVENEEVYEKFMKAIFTSIPVSQHSARYCLKQFNVCEKEFGTRRYSVSPLSKGPLSTSTIKEYSETKYYQILELLYNMRCPYSPKKAETKRDIPRSQSRSKEYIGEITSTLYSYDNATAENSTSTTLYYAISPDYNSLFDSIIIGKPKSSFLLFVLGFSKDSAAAKAEIFFKILEYANLQPTLSSFQILAQAYILLNLNFSLQLYDCIQKNKNKCFLEDVATELNIKLNNQSLDQWAEYNAGLIKSRASRALLFSLVLSQVLAHIVEDKVSQVNVDNYSKTARVILNDTDVQELKNMLKSKGDLPINESSITLLAQIEPYIFDTAQLAGMLRMLTI